MYTVYIICTILDVHGHVCVTCTVGDNKKLTLRFRLYGVNTIRRVAKNDYETIPYQGDNRVDETIEAFFASTERARKAF